MQGQTKQIPRDDDVRRAERAIVLHTLGEGRDRACSRERLAAELGDVEPQALAKALARLDREGVVVLGQRTVQASRATTYLDELELIAL